MKLIDDTNEFINETLKAAEEERAELQKTLDTENAEADAARDEMSRATDEGDLEAYKAASSRLSDAEIAAQMHKTRLDKLTGKPLITEDDYNTRVNDIMKAIRTEDREALNKLCDLAEEMNQVASNLSKDIGAANNCLHRLQYDMYQCKDVDHMLFNNTVVPDYAEKKYKNYDTVNFGKNAVNQFMYKNARRGH